MTNFRDQQTGTTPCPDMGWKLESLESVRSAHMAKLCLGRLPRRAAKYACANFEIDDIHEYRGDDGMSAQGRVLAGLATFIVRRAKNPMNYLRALTHLSAQLITPLKTYLRVKLAVGRLEAEILRAADIVEQTPSPPADTAQSAPKKSRATHLDIAAAGVGKEAKPKSFTWHTSPAKTYDFKRIAAEYGYDPRGTSVYWIERRANRLRRKWSAYQKAQSAADKRPAPRHELASRAAKVIETNAGPDIRYFEPVEADYNSVWPPVALPSGPPKPPPSKARVGAAQVQTGAKMRVNDECKAAAALPPKHEIVPDGTSARADILRSEAGEYAAQTHQNSAAISPEFQAVQDAAAAARAKAEACGNGWVIPAEYAQMFGFTAPQAPQTLRPSRTGRDPP